MTAMAIEEMPDECEAKTMALIMDVLLSVGATWELIRIELFRIANEPVPEGKDPPFRRVPSQRTLERILLEEFGCASMTEYKEKRKDGTAVQLKFKAVNMAMSGNVPMLIFCLKNLAGWSDNVKMITKDPKNGAFQLAYSESDLK